MRFPRLPLHPYLFPEQVAFDLGNAARNYPWGDRLHLLFGLLWCFFAPWPNSFVEFAGAPLAVCFAIRAPFIWRTWGSFAVQPLFLLIVLWTAWQATTLAWTPDLHHGLHELSCNRWVWLMWALWPIMRFRNWLIAALVAGFLCGNASQLGHAIGRHWHIAALVWPRFPDRNSGWWDPVVGGSLLVAALGLHLPAALMGKGRWRWIGLSGVIASLLAIGATGTRGAWIAAAMLCEMAISISVLRTRPWWRKLAHLGVVALVTAAIIGAVFLVSGDTIRGRARQGWDEVRRATNLENPDFFSDTGARVFMAALAIHAVKTHPIGGVGAGGYREWCRAQIRAAGHNPDDAPIHAHPHDAPLHIAATTGLIGLFLSALIAAVALYGGFTELGPPGPKTGLGSYAAAPAFGLLGLFLAGLFDPVHLNAQTGAVMATLMAMCLVSRHTHAEARRTQSKSG
jgi:O-antigen ligase